MGKRKKKLKEESKHKQKRQEFSFNLPKFLLPKDEVIVERPFCKADLLAIAGLLVLVFIFFFKAATLQGVFITGDLSRSDIWSINYPFRHFLGECLKKGIPPLWTPDIYCGFPIFAEGEMGGYYPLNVILFYFLPTYIAYNYSIILNFFLTSLFMFFYARSINLSPFASFIASFSFSFGGFFVTHLKHTNMINAACWLPLMFFFVERFFKKGNFIYPILCGLVFGIQILAGHFQIAYYSILGISMYFIFRLGSKLFPFLIDKKRFKNVSFKKLVIQFSVALLVIYIIGVSLSAVQILPTKELTELSYRAEGISFKSATMYPYHPKNLITFIFPYWFGDYANATYPEKIEREEVVFWENCGYVGVITLSLAFLGLIMFFLRRGEIRFFTLLLIFSILIVFGKYSPVYEFIWNSLPGMKFFRFHNRFLLFVSFSLCILAGFGIKFLLSKIKKGAATQRFLKIIICLVVIFDLFKFGIHHNPIISPNIWLAKPKTVEFLQRDKTFYRIHNFGADSSWWMIYLLSKGWKDNLNLYVNHREVLQPSFNMVFRISSVEGCPEFTPKRLNKIFYFFYNEENVNTYARKQGKYKDIVRFALPKPQFTKLLSILNVKYILTFWEMKSPALKELFNIDFKKEMIPVRVYENKEFVPRVYVVPNAKVIKTEGGVEAEIISSQFNPNEYIIVEEDINFNGSESIEGSKVEITKYSPLEVVIEANMTNSGFLVLADTYYPGWKVFVDGKEDRIYQANYIQRAVLLEKGKHNVRFIYDPISFKIGALITLVTISLILILLIIAIRKIKQN
ncbi:MAG: YfhO family protein [bacterium]